MWLTMLLLFTCLHCWCLQVPMTHSSPTQTAKQQQQHCEVCEVDYPAGEEARELHDSGKRHMRARAQREALTALAHRSVFIKWKEGGGGEGGSQTGLTKDQVAEAMTTIGPVERVLHRADAHYAIVEFADEEHAQMAVLQRNMSVAGVSVLVSERKLNFSAPPSEKKTIDVMTVASSTLSGRSFVEQIDIVVDHIALKPQQLAEREAYATRIEHELAKFFASPKVKVFGSSITSIGTVDSDIDASVSFDSVPDEQMVRGGRFIDMGRDKYTLLTADTQTLRGRRVHADEMLRLSPADRARFVSKVLNEVRKEVGWLGHQRPVLDARCPIVRFIADRTVLIDLSMDNRLGVAKSEWLRDVIEADKGRKMGRILLGFRFWALSNGLFDPVTNTHKGQFNAYMLNLMCVAYMQTVGLLPAVEFTDKEELAGRFRVDYVVPAYDLSGVDVAGLFKSIFVHFVETDSRPVVYSVREGRLIPMGEFVEKYPEEQADIRYGLMNVQDPLELSHNVTQNLAEKALSRMRRVMMYGLAAMKQHKDSYSALLCLDDVPRTSSAQSSLGPVDAACSVPHLPQWADGDMIRETIDSVLEDILGCERDDRPAVKRRRAGEEMEEDKGSETLGVYTVRARLWIGRRNVRRRLGLADGSGREVAGGFELEKQVSHELLLAADMQAGEIAKVRIAWQVNGGDVLRIGFMKKEGCLADITNMAHFMETLLAKHLEPIMAGIKERREEAELHGAELMDEE